MALEIVRLLEKRRETVAGAMLLDPPNLAPWDRNISKEFGGTILADSLALKARAGADGCRYAEYIDELARIELFEHMRQTSAWYIELMHT